MELWYRLVYVNLSQVGVNYQYRVYYYLTTTPTPRFELFFPYDCAQ